MTGNDSTDEESPDFTVSDATRSRLGPRTADLASWKMTERYRYVVNHTPNDYPVPTRIEFVVETGFNALDGLGIAYRKVGDSPPTAEAELTTPEVAAVLGVAVAGELRYVPHASDRVDENDG